MKTSRVVIIGGGFSGTALAAHLARQAVSRLHITIIEPRVMLGAGLAYSSPDPAHRINVPASRMQLSGMEEGDFDHWYRQQPEFYLDSKARLPNDDVYPQRSMFGRYVAERLAQAQEQNSLVTVEHIRDTAVQLAGRSVVTESGNTLEADIIVLAISHPPPALPRLLVPFSGHPALIDNPWLSGALAKVKKDERIAIMGTGLSMADVLATLHGYNHTGSVLAFSRRGLLSRPNLTTHYNLPEQGSLWEKKYSTLGFRSVRHLLQHIRTDIIRMAEQGIPWQIVLDAVRTHGQELWQKFPLVEQQRFLRHLRSFWDVHRYRIAPQVAEIITHRQQQGNLSVIAARLVKLETEKLKTEKPEADKETLTLSLKLRQGELIKVTVDKFIITTGPAHSTLTDSQPLLQDLARRGIIQPDVLGLGLHVDEHSHAIDRYGHSHPTLLIVGPAARGRFGELMGLPQVAEHAVTVADEVLHILHLSEPLSELPHSCLSEMKCKS
ncbi:FAD/NAD(P)-binding protein [Xenorhabdus innexi]|uniref:FAD-dependent oxidoreductase n=1 Tax=Xenorhabdus innexi TaxID=290109 RepID=A0A1N6MTY2_9GAMM|nr:FAD/NAD(P)-binding protein [Xenorhabdus innexi]PHM33415.1 FAD-dependent oxidoreductase [Xenorhabdus innexi]SIP72270.1 FAD-dependent oxidoreductase [Xenorhabdus innexi]